MFSSICLLAAGELLNGARSFCAWSPAAPCAALSKLRAFTGFSASSFARCFASSWPIHGEGNTHGSKRDGERRPAPDSSEAHARWVCARARAHTHVHLCVCARVAHCVRVAYFETRVGSDEISEARLFALNFCLGRHHCTCITASAFACASGTNSAWPKGVQCVFTRVCSCINIWLCRITSSRRRRRCGTRLLACRRVTAVSSIHSATERTSGRGVVVNPLRL